MSNTNIGQFGDTTLTKVFVGGLAWETQNEAMKEYFDKYGEILEAVIISDKITGRSKGYGFVTFKEPESAKKACEDPTPVINGRRANCNLASLGARRPRSSSATSPQGGPRSTTPAPAATNQVQWYYPTGTPASPFHHQPQAIPFHAYGYSPTYIATDMGYNQKLSYSSGGSYMNGGHYSQVYPGPAQGMMPVYPVYHFNRPQTMGVAAPHIYPYSTAGPVTTIPAVISKPPSMAPNTEINPHACCSVVK
ncbi:Rna-binding protein [Thalictrum thalictroides]|uniref:Rna-binding protein n=1 Tax=Thalictrum thalictroides TaxID=46969 RepID=A0A7J6XD74_THATH|nr:Rna-binding protein [Thalictrum thalictroides]